MKKPTKHQKQYRKRKLESFHAFQCIRSYFYDPSMDDLEGINSQYEINM